MQALLIVAHGSRRAASNQEVAALAAVLAQQSSRFALIDYAFLEMAAPNIATGLQQMVAKGAQQITVLPYFLSAGNHVIRDVPRIIAEFSQQHPHLAINIAPHFGLAPGIADLVLAQAGSPAKI